MTRGGALAIFVDLKPSGGQYPLMPLPSTEDEIRAAALIWIKDLTFDGAIPVTREQLANDFVFARRRFPRVDRGRGIRKPVGWRSALSIITPAAKPGRVRDL